MDKKLLHITNGDSLNDRLLALNYEGKYAVWREMLCDGPTRKDLKKSTFAQTRCTFFEEEHQISSGDYSDKFLSQIEKIQRIDSVDEIVLWFEYDLFCHINMLACISLLKKSGRKEPISLVCSGRIAGENTLKGLGELTEDQLQQHYDDRVLLTSSDIDIAHYLWSLYCNGKVRKMKPRLARGSNFRYLSNCLRALKERFPNIQSGLNSLETQVLKLIDTNEIKSKHHLCGYVLSHQGYYGFGDMQILKIIDRLGLFYKEENGLIILSTQGKQVLRDGYNFYNDMKDDTVYGGTRKYKYVYDSSANKLVKHK